MYANFYNTSQGGSCMRIFFVLLYMLIHILNSKLRNKKSSALGFSLILCGLLLPTDVRWIKTPKHQPLIWINFPKSVFSHRIAKRFR